MPSQQGRGNTLALTFDSTKTAGQKSHEALKNNEGSMAKPTLSEIGEASAKRSGERMKKNEDDQGIFTK